MKIQILTVKINNMNLKKLRPLIAILALIAYFARFEPVLRFSVASDIHIQTSKTPEEEKMAKMISDL